MSKSWLGLITSKINHCAAHIKTLGDWNCVSHLVLVNVSCSYMLFFLLWVIQMLSNVWFHACYRTLYIWKYFFIFALKDLTDIIMSTLPFQVPVVPFRQELQPRSWQRPRCQGIRGSGIFPKLFRTNDFNLYCSVVNCSDCEAWILGIY